MNRKLIRPNLADMKGREPREQQNSASRNEPNTGAARRPSVIKAQSNAATAIIDSGDGGAQSSAVKQNTAAAAVAPAAPAAAPPRRVAPPVETNAEIFYYKKQIDSHTPMVIVLTDNEEIEGTIEWYDRAALKVNRKNAPNIMLLKHNIKYMYKAEDRA